MGIFADYAPIYWENGYSIVPCKPGERGTFVDYAKYRHQRCSESELNEWVERFPNYNIALVVGEASNIGVIDIDIKDDEPELLSKALSIFPRSPLERFGSKGLGILFRYNGQSHRQMKYKGKVIGEILTNTIVLVPPSIHWKTGKPYEWTGQISLEAEMKQDVLSELPCPTDEELSLCEQRLEYSDIVVDDKFFEERVGRNNKLKEICGAMIKRKMTPERIAPLLHAEDLALHPGNPLFSDRGEFKSLAAQPLACAYKFASSVFRTYLVNASYSGEAIPQFNQKKLEEEKPEELAEGLEYLKFKDFFQQKLKSAKRDRMDGVLKMRDWRGFWQPIGNSLKRLKSEASDVGLRPNNLPNHFERYEHNCKQEMLYKVSEWSGHDYIGEMVSYLKCSNVETPLMAELVKEWMSKILMRFDTGAQNTMVLFHGEQGKGKDMFIENLTGGYAPYFSNFTDTMQEKDMFMQVAKNLVINVSEFDRLNNKHPGMIKDLISRRTANFRPSHMQFFEDYRMNASFIGSTNSMNFLTDPTGNRRFWVFFDVEIDWQYPKFPREQIVAQATALYKSGFKASDQAVKKMGASVNAHTPESTESVFIEEWNAALGEALASKGVDQLSYAEAKSVIHYVARSMNFKSIRTTQSLLKQLGGQKRDKKSRYYVKISR